MGYYTQHYLAIRDEKGNRIYREHPMYNELRRCFNNVFYTGFHSDEDDSPFGDLIHDCYEAKWYDCENDMDEFVKLHPEYEYVLEGCGEDRNDWWIETWKNGKFTGREYAKLILPKKPDWYAAQGDVSWDEDI